MFKKKVRKGDRFNQNLLINEGIALKDKSKLFKFSKTFSQTNLWPIYFVCSYSVIQLNLVVKIISRDYQIHDYNWEAKSKFSK